METVLFSLSLFLSLSLSLFLSLSLSSLLLSMEIQKIHSQADKLKIWRNRSLVTSACFPNNLSAFFSFFLSMWQATNHMILSFFLSFKITRENVKNFTFRSFVFLPFFFSFISFFLFHLIFSFFEDYNKNGRYLTFRSFFLPSFLSFFSVLKSAYCDVCRLVCFLFFSLPM